MSLKYVLIGAGKRGQAYSEAAFKEHGCEIVAVADPNENVRNYIRDTYNVPHDMCFESYEQVLKLGKIADFAMICTQDKMHMPPAMMAIEQGYDILLEKPAAPTPEECMQLCKAFDLPVTSNADRHYITGYTDSLAPNSYDSYHSSYSFMLAKGPTTLDHRYLTEDAPFSMVCLSSLANALGLRTPLMDSIAYLGGALMQTDYWKNGRTIKDLGLDGLTLPEMKEILENGYPE